MSITPLEEIPEEYITIRATVYAPAPPEVRYIEVSPAFDMDVVGLLSTNGPGEIIVSGLSIGDEEWDDVDPHLFFYGKNFPYYPVRNAGWIGKDRPLKCGFTVHPDCKFMPAPALSLFIVGTKRVAGDPRTNRKW